MCEIQSFSNRLVTLSGAALLFADLSNLAALPTIVTQPRSQTVAPGATASFTVEALGTEPLTYRWLKDGNYLSEGDNLSGVFTTNLVITNVQVADLALYSVLVSDPLGSRMSADARLAFTPPPFAWVRTLDGSGTSEETDQGTDVKTDEEGNVYTTGSFVGTAAFGTTNLTSAGARDIFLAKLTSNGDLVWVRQAGGPGDDLANGLAIDKEGRIWMTGFFGGTASFGAINLTSAGTNDIFVAQWDRDGAALWARRAGGGSPDEGCRIALDTNGHGYVVGSFKGSATFGANTLVSAGDFDAFVAKFDPVGELVWARSFGGTNADRACAVGVDGAGRCYVAGTYMGPAQFGWTNLNGRSERHSFLTCLNPAGDLLWVSQGGAGYPGDVHGLAVGADGQSFVTGLLKGYLFFVERYNAAGRRQWLQLFDNGVSGWSVGAATLDRSTNLCVVDTFRGSAFAGLIDHGTNTTLTLFVAKFDSGGVLHWARAAGRELIGLGISVDALANAYITGWARDLAPARSSDHSPASSDGMSIYAAKLGAAVPPAPLVFSVPSLSLSGGVFHLELTGGNVSRPVVLEGSENLTDWSPVATNPFSGSTVSFTDMVTNFTYRFYRGKQTP